jgi:hypothetical protein
MEGGGNKLLREKPSSAKFDILVTVYLGIILINNQLDRQFLLYIFISIKINIYKRNCVSSWLFIRTSSATLFTKNFTCIVLGLTADFHSERPATNHFSSDVHLNNIL